MFGVKKQLGPRQVKTELLIYPFAYKPLAQGSFFQSKNEILSRFEGLKGISRDGLVKLVDVTRGSQGRLYIVMERPEDGFVSLSEAFHGLPLRNIDQLRNWACQLLGHLHYLQTKHGIVHHSLSSHTVFYNPTSKNESPLLLMHWHMFHLTGCGSDVMFPLGQPSYLAPETVLEDSISHKSDIWALGILLCELYYGQNIYDVENELDALDIIGNIAESDATPSVLHSKIAQDTNMDKDLQSFILCCLVLSPEKRPSAETLLSYPFLQPLMIDAPSEPRVPWPQLLSDTHDTNDTPIDTYQLFNLWLNNGGHLDKLYLKMGASSSLPSLDRIPPLVRLDDNIQQALTQSVGQVLHSKATFPISLSDLYNKLLQSKGPDAKEFDTAWKDIQPWRFETISDCLQRTARVKLHLESKEKNDLYQFHLMHWFTEKLRLYPLSIDVIRLKAVHGISPLMRGPIWAALLGIQGDPQVTFAVFDRDIVTPMDHQLKLDIPRCHQYHELLSSSCGHEKLRRVLKAWVVSETGTHVYWQGLDSVLAPFVATMYNDEALAFASLQAFLKRFCLDFFVQDNACIIDRYSNALRCVLTLHDPVLANHMRTIGIEPRLFAIPWFMTTFAHVFSMDKIYHIWDTLLVSPDWMPIVFAFAVIHELRDQILEQDFNQNMVTFTQLPPVDIHQCIVNAVLFTQLTPPSLVQEILDPDSSRSPEALESLPVGHISFDEFLEIQNLSLLLDIRGSPSNPVNHVLGAILVQRPEQVTDLVHQHGHRFIGSFTILIYDQETEGKMKLIWEELRVIPRVLLLGLSEETTKRLILCSCSGGLLKDSRLISACSSFKE